MPKKIWIFELDGRQSTVELDHGTISGKRRILANGIPVVQTRRLFDMGSEHHFELSRHQCTVRIRPNWVNWVFFNHANPDGQWKYECFIDGADTTTVEQQAAVEIKRALEMIKQARNTGLVVAGLTLALLAVNTVAETSLFGIDLWSLFDVAIIGVLTLGVHRRIRIAAISLFAYFVVNELYIWSQVAFPSVTRVMFTIALGALLFQGIRGTFAYNRLNKRSHAALGTQ